MVTLANPNEFRVQVGISAELYASTPSCRVVYYSGSEKTARHSGEQDALAYGPGAVLVIDRQDASGVYCLFLSGTVAPNYTLDVTFSVIPKQSGRGRLVNSAAEEDVDRIVFERDDDSDARYWAMKGGCRYCYVVGANGVYMAEREGQSFGPAKTKRAAVRLVEAAS